MTSKHYKDILDALGSASAVAQSCKAEPELETQRAISRLLKAQVYFMKLMLKAEQREKRVADRSSSK